MSLRLPIAALLLTIGLTARAEPSPVAQYDFNGSLSSSVAGAPALTATDPLALSGFGVDTVLGGQRQVWNFTGGPANADQAGLTLASGALLSSSSVYSLEVVFKFTQRENAWRRIVDVQSRQTDSGFYVDPSNNLDIFPVGGGAAFTNTVYHDVFLVNNNGSVTFYLDGSAQATLATSVMNIDASGNINFFLDNVVGGGQGEYSNGSIALVRLYNEALGTLPPPVPEPAAMALMMAGLLSVAGAVRWRRRLG